VINHVHKSMNEIAEQPREDESSATKSRPGRKSRFGFGLKTLFAFATLVALFLAFLVPQVKQARKERNAVAAIKELFPGSQEPTYNHVYLFGKGKPTDRTYQLAPNWIRSMFGSNIFCAIKEVRISELIGFDGIDTGEAHADPELMQRHKGILDQLLNFRALETLTIYDWHDQVRTDDLAQLNSLRSLRLLSWISLNDLSGIGNMDHLESLSIISSSVESLEPLSGCKSLKHLNLSSCGALKNIDVVSHLPNLVSLRLPYCQKLESLAPLSNLTNLEILNVGSSLSPIPVFDFGWIRNCRNLRKLHVSSFSQFTNLQLLAQFEELEELNIYACLGLIDLPPMEHTPNLRSVKIEQCHIRRLQGLSRATSVKTLVVSGCDKLDSLDGLGNLNQLERCTISECPRIETLPRFSATDLTFENCERLSSIEDLDLDSIKVVRFRNCPKVTKDQIERLKETPGLTVEWIK